MVYHIILDSPVSTWFSIYMILLLLLFWLVVPRVYSCILASGINPADFSGDHVECCGSSPGWPHTRQMPYLLYYPPSPLFVFGEGGLRGIPSAPTLLYSQIVPRNVEDWTWASSFLQSFHFSPLTLMLIIYYTMYRLSWFWNMCRVNCSWPWVLKMPFEGEVQSRNGVVCDEVFYHYKD